MLLFQVMDTKFVLTPGVEASIEYAGKIGPNVDGFRVIMAIRSTIPKNTAGLIKRYEVWCSEEYLEDNKYKPTEEGASSFAEGVLKRRFQESGNTVPKENGLKATNEYGVELGNPQNISKSLTRLNVVVTKQQAKWLKKRAIEINSNISAIVRSILDEQIRFGLKKYG